MTTVLQTAEPRGFVEKTALERYVPPAKPSLVGLSRAQLADALGTIGVAEKQRKMRVQQLWNWIYVRGVTRFDRHDQRVEGCARRARRALHARPPRGRRRAGLGRRHAQVAAAAARRARRRAAARGRVRLHSGERPRDAVRVEPGRLHAHLHVLPHRHAAPRAQSHARRDRRAGDGRARPAGRLAGRHAARRRDRADRRRALRHQHRHDGDGRAALQFRCGARRAADRAGRRRHRHFQAAHHAVHVGRGAEHRARGRRDRHHAGDLAACGARRVARRTGAAQSQISDRHAARCLPQLSGRLERASASPSST